MGFNSFNRFGPFISYPELTLITASEGSQLHLERLRSRLEDFDPATRDRFLAGAMIPSSWYLQAQRFRRWFQTQARTVFEQVDVLIAPKTPCTAPYIDQTTIDLAGKSVSVRAHLGLYTQPLSFIGLPVLSVPVVHPGKLPMAYSSLPPLTKKPKFYRWPIG